MTENTLDSASNAPVGASELLNAFRTAKEGVEARTPKEWKVFALWGCWILVFVPPFDFVNGNLWWLVVAIASVLGGILTTLYLSVGSRRIHWARQFSWRVWPVIGVFYGMIMALAIFEQGHFRYAWTSAALIGALPYLVSANVIRNRERRSVTP